MGAGVAALLASAPLGAIVQGYAWLGQTAAVAGIVVALGLALHRAGPVAVAVGQCLGVLLLVTAEFADGAVLGVLPGPAAFASLRELLSGAGAQIAVGIAPVAATPEILFLVTAAFGVVAVAVYVAAVLADAPAAAGVPLLAVFAVPAALDDDLLPWGTMVCAAAGFGVLLVVRDGARRQSAGGVVLVAAAIAVSLGFGAVTGVGTTGRFAGSGGGGGGSIGLSPFTSLRGQLTQTNPGQLFHVRGLPQPTYLRALTLSTYVPDVGWQPTRPGTGPSLPGTIGVVAGAGMQVADVDVENVGFKDYWLPLYGSPVGVTGLQGHYTFDEASGTAYTNRPREEESWVQTAALSTPTADQLRAAPDRNGPVASVYLDTRGIDQRVTDIARQATAGTSTAFDKAIALQEYFTGPGSPFRYSLSTAPGNGDDALVDFLTVGKTGYCEQFSAAMAVMLRSVGVPARVAVGFTGGTTTGDYRTVSTSDAHAWVEAWFAGYGWMTFDPTPLTDGRTIVPPYVAQAEAQQAGQASGDATETDPGSDARQQPEAQPTPTQAPAAPDTAAPGPSDSGWSPWPFVAGLAVVLLVGAALLPAALRTRERRRRLAAAAEGGPDAASAAWAELQADSDDRGVPPRPTDTVRVAARRLAREHHLDETARQHLRELVGAVEASWYGGRHPERGELEEPLGGLLTAVGESTPLSWQARLLPRSLRRGARRRSPRQK